MYEHVVSCALNRRRAGGGPASAYQDPGHTAPPYGAPPHNPGTLAHPVHSFVTPRKRRSSVGGLNAVRCTPFACYLLVRWYDLALCRCSRRSTVWQRARPCRWTRLPSPRRSRPAAAPRRTRHAAHTAPICRRYRRLLRLIRRRKLRGAHRPANRPPRRTTVPGCRTRAGRAASRCIRVGADRPPRSDGPAEA